MRLALTAWTCLPMVALMTAACLAGSIATSPGRKSAEQTPYDPTPWTPRTGSAVGATASAVTKEHAVLQGLRWLKESQNTNGSWGSAANELDAATGAAVLAFLGNGETGHLTVTVKNQGSVALTGVTATITSTNAKLTFPACSTIQIGSVAAHSEGSGSIPVALTGAAGIETSDLTIALNDPALGLAGAVNVKKTTPLNYDVKPNASTFSSFEPEANGWSVIGTTPKLGDVFNWERREMSPIHHTFAATDSNAPTDTSLVSPLMHVGTDTIYSPINKVIANPA